VLPDVDLAEFPGEVSHGEFRGSKGDDAGGVDVGFDRLGGDDRDDAERARGVEEGGAAGAAV
jgi:hypothetical protein